MKSIWIICVGLLIAAGIGLVPALSQDTGDDEGADTSGDEMEAWKKLQEPGDPHKLLEKMAGDWDMQFKMWMQPDADPTVMEMTTTLEMIYGGRFLHGTYEMTEGPFPHNGETLFGYSNTEQKYQWMRTTDMDTHLRVYEGTYDEKTKTIKTQAEYSMEWSGETHEVKETNVWTFHGDDKFTMEVLTKYGEMDPIKEVEITYTRAAKKAPATQDPHGVLALLEGDFKVDMKIWFEPGADPMEMTAEMTYDWTLDGQHIVAEYDASDMEMMPHKGIEYISYNVGTGEYESIRLTSTSGAMLVWKGTYDKEAKTLEFTADASMETDGETVSWTSRAVYEWVNDDKYNCTVYSKYEGMEEEVKEIEMTFTRK